MHIKSAIPLMFGLVLSAQPPLETREYRADNGRKIRITSLGNLAGYEAPAGFEHIAGARTREGYVVAYYDPIAKKSRVVHDVIDRYSSTIASGQRDLLPVSLTGPASGTVFSMGQDVTATAVVDTRDGVLRLTHVFHWRAGLGGVSIETTIANKLTGLSVGLQTFKGHSDPNVSGKTRNNFTRAGGQAIVDDRCDPNGWCPPPPENVLAIGGYPDPTNTIIKNAFDDSELTSATAVLSSNLTGVRIQENDQVTLVWSIGSWLAPNASLKVTRFISLQ